MSTPQQPEPATAAPSVTCGACSRSVTDAYYTVGKSVFCRFCKAASERKTSAPIAPEVLANATLYGLGGAALGAAIYGAVKIAGLEIGIVAVAVAFLVGRGIQIGAMGQKGRALQILALVLTYLGVSGGYAIAYIKDGTNPLLALGLPIIIVGGLPQTSLTAIIVTVGLWYVWQMNAAPTPPVFHGPFRE
jgi:hypothetical protein